MRTCSRFSLVLLALFFCGLSLSAQQEKKKLTIYFASDEAALSPASKKSIDSLLLSNSLAGRNARITITGFTDSTGSVEYNRQLSEKRAKATADYFKAKGFARTTCVAKAESNAVGDNGTERGKSLNRRVEITFDRVPVSVDRIGKVGAKEETFGISAKNGGSITAASGTTMNIPPDAFVDANGNPVTGKVDVSYTEYRDPIDFIFANVPMTVPVNGVAQPFNSAGMFRLLAYQDGKPVYLANGKQIDMKFAATQNLPNLDFYRYDTVAGKWQTLSPLTNANGQSVNPHADSTLGGRLCGFVDGHEVCMMDDCYARYFLVKYGPRFASESNSLYAQVRRYDSLKAIEDGLSARLAFLRSRPLVNKVRRDSVIDQQKRQQHYYKLRKVSASNGETVFEIKCSNAGSEWETMKKITWRYGSDMTTLDDSIFRRKWSECRLEAAMDGTFNLSLKSANGKQVDVPGIEIIFADKVKKKKRREKAHELFLSYDSAYSVYKGTLASLEKRVDSLGRDDLRLKRESDSLALVLAAFPSYEKIPRDSLFCFYSINLERVTNSVAEQKLGFYGWLKYFDEHKAELLPRYEAIRQEQGYADCERVGRQQDAVVNAQQVMAANQQKLQEKTSGVFQSLSVSSLGIYNCDQVARLGAPVVMVSAAYENEEHQPLNIILVYIIDNTLNGILRYDGYNNMMPGKFAYSSSARTTMIAFDDQLNAYLYTPEQFAAIPKKSGNITYIFTLKKMKTPATREQLQQQI